MYDPSEVALTRSWAFVASSFDTLPRQQTNTPPSLGMAVRSKNSPDDRDSTWPGPTVVTETAFLANFQTIFVSHAGSGWT